MTAIGAPNADMRGVGLYPGVAALDYHRWPGASQTRLNLLRNASPAHLKWAMDHPDEPTAAMRLGAAVHTCVLEPDVFAARVLRDIPGDGRTKAIRDARAELAAQHPDATILPAADYDICLAIRESVAAHPRAMALLEGQHECSAVWTDPATGVRCRGRFDDLAVPLGAITDLKTTADASPLRFPRSVYQFGYHIQAAHYLRGGRALGYDVDTFGIVAVEKDPPYAVAVYQLTAPAIYDGERELDVLLARWAECERSGVWPGYSTDVVPIDLPTWAPFEINSRVEAARP